MLHTHKYILNWQCKETFDLFTSLMLSDKNIWISRLGGSDTYIYNKYKNNTNTEYDESYITDIQYIRRLNGYFNKNDDVDILQKSIKLYEESIDNSDFILLCTSQLIEGNYSVISNIFDINTYKCPIMIYHFIEEFYPFFNSFKIWGKNKKILVISPFSESIKYQTSKDRINNLLKLEFPDCEIITYQTPITYNTKFESTYFNQTTENYNNWIELAQKMVNEISKINFDIALISAGIYTMHLGNEIKKMNKKAIYIGGMLNVFFNIYGERYKTFNIYQNLNYQIDVLDKFGDLHDNKELQIKNESVGAYFRTQ
jgi:hypothetical protein